MESSGPGLEGRYHQHPCCRRGHRPGTTHACCPGQLAHNPQVHRFKRSDEINAWASFSFLFEHWLHVRQWWLQRFLAQLAGPGTFPLGQSWDCWWSEGRLDEPWSSLAQAPPWEALTKETCLLPGNQRKSQQLPMTNACPSPWAGTTSCGEQLRGSEQAGLVHRKSPSGPTGVRVHTSDCLGNGWRAWGGGWTWRTGRRNWEDRTRGPSSSHRPQGHPQEHSSGEAVLCSTEQLGGKWEIGTELQITFQTPSQACEWRRHPLTNWECSALTAGPQFQEH